MKQATLTNNISLAAILVILLPALTAAQQQDSFHIAAKYSIPGTGRWDYVALGPDNKRLYVSHGSQVNVIDALTGDSIGVIPNTTGVHGIAFIPALNKGYTSNGNLNTVTVFDLTTHNVLSQIATGLNPDAIIYETYAKEIVTCNGQSNDLTFIDPATEKTMATLDLWGKPEMAVSDGKGKLYVNIEDKNEIIVVNMKTHSIENHWPLEPAVKPTGLALDRSGKRLFSGCDMLLVVMDASTGKIVTKLPIAEGCDGVAFDARNKLIFASCGSGVLNIIHQESPDKYTSAQNLLTKKSAKTLAICESSQTIYLPAGDFGIAEKGQRRAPVIPGSFQILVVRR